MALVVSKNEKSSKRTSFRSEKKPWMLRDYLRDDMSSCSSNGFRSFPRKQCCIAVKNMIEIEANRSKPPQKLLVKNRNRNRNVSAALQRASMAVINAVKLIPFRSAVVSNGGSGRRFLPRSFSKKLFNRSFFWKKSSSVDHRNDVVFKRDCVEQCVIVDEDDDDEIERWISSGVAAKEIYEPLDLSNDTSVTNASTTSNSNSNNSNDGKSSDCWSDITFTSDYLPILSENDSVSRRQKLKGKSGGGDDGGGGEEEEVVGQSVGVLTGDDSIAHQPAAVIQKSWCNEQAETEQLSPISVMDFPCSDEGSASPFTVRESRLKGTKERLMEKLGRFESLAAGLGLDPVNLEALMSSSATEDESLKHCVQSCSTPSYILSSESESEEEEDDDEQSQEDEEENRVQQLIINIINLKKPDNKFEYENLLLNFFRENVAQKADEALLKSAEDWLNGHYDTLILGWEVKDKRQAYIRDMEERGRWPRDCKLETEEVANALEAEIFETLIQEVFLELC
ncbi:hypothetical protein RND81_13G042200 [Saponaria officinalis]|uniref:DUF4378 domain-containing protein n=1 Tax=Saponaria officinalis TaxID=3572 RepID=A0AAW1GTX4_SAPOF